MTSRNKKEMDQTKSSTTFKSFHPLGFESKKKKRPVWMVTVTCLRPIKSSPSPPRKPNSQGTIFATATVPCKTKSFHGVFVSSTTPETYLDMEGSSLSFPGKYLLVVYGSVSGKSKKLDGDMFNAIFPCAGILWKISLRTYSWRPVLMFWKS